MRRLVNSYHFRKILVMIRMLICAVVTLTLFAGDRTFAGAPALRIATFDVDATPRIGSPVAYALTRKILAPLHARGVVLLPLGQQPIVLCSVDWIGIGNGGQDRWRQALATAAGTVPERVDVHSIHQHDGPRCDFTAVQLFTDPKQAEPHYDVQFAQDTIDRAARAVKNALEKSQPVTAIGTGRARVEKVASNRRLLGPDGKVATMRFSSCRDAKAIAAPEGVIDPYLKLISFWNGDNRIVCLAYYATHPMSYYGKGDVSPDFVGMARAARDTETGVPHVYFTGAAGNVAAGKYNDGSEKVRPILAERMEQAMRAAWDATDKQPVDAATVQWRVVPVSLPPAEHLDAAALRATLQSTESTDSQRLGAATDLAWLSRCQAGKQINLTCLRLGDIYVVNMPGELFVEYQLAAEQMRPDSTVCMAAYGDYGPGYIGTRVAYGQGGYETSPRASRVAPDVESVLMDALKKLLASSD